MTIDEFRTLYPEFATIDDPVVQRFLDVFVCQFGTEYGCMTDELQALFVAHRLTLWQKTSSGASGPQLVTTNRSVGDVSVSGYVAGGGDGSHGDYSSTAYGIQFWESIKLYGGGPVMAGSVYG